MQKKQNRYTHSEAISNTILKELETLGYCLIENVSQDEVYTIISSLGKPVKQESGEAHLVTYHKGYDDFRFSRSMNEIGPHSEYPYYKTPPRTQILFCVKPSDCEGGQTYTCHIQNLLKELSNEELEILRSVKINFSANKDLVDFQSKNKVFPILSEISNNSYIFRFSHNLFYYGDINAKMNSEKKGDFLVGIKNPKFQQIIEKLLDYFDANKQTWNIPKNGLLVWNNHHIVHWRAGYKDKSRKLVRFLIA